MLLCIPASYITCSSPNPSSSHKLFAQFFANIREYTFANFLKSAFDARTIRKFSVARNTTHNFQACPLKKHFVHKTIISNNPTFEIAHHIPQQSCLKKKELKVFKYVQLHMSKKRGRENGHFVLKNKHLKIENY